MGVTIDLSLFGADITQPEKERSIFLEPEAWEHLGECTKQIEQAFSSGKDQQWVLDENRDIRAHLNKFKGCLLLHIRYWWKDRPTRKGISLTSQEWKEVQSYMVLKAEISLGIKVITRLVNIKLHEIIKTHCEGCSKDWPSQRDHICLMDAKTQANLHFEKAVADVEPAEFISVLASEAEHENVVLEQPHHTFKRIMHCHMAKIKKDVLTDFE